MEAVIRPSALWADSWYPWLANGWVKCTCGQYFHSREGGDRANDLHADHVATSTEHSDHTGRRADGSWECTEDHRTEPCGRCLPCQRIEQEKSR